MLAPESKCGETYVGGRRLVSWCLYSTHKLTRTHIAFWSARGGGGESHLIAEREGAMSTSHLYSLRIEKRRERLEW